MSKFNIGDMVKCKTYKDGVQKDATGRVDYVFSIVGKWNYLVRREDGKIMPYFEHELEPLLTEETTKVVIEGFMGGNLMSDGRVVQYDGFRKVTNEMECLYSKKNHDYGDSFSKLFKEFGLDYSVPRIYEKAMRLKTLLKAKNEVNESVRDTLIDICVYAALTIVELDKNTNGNGKDLQKSDHS